MRVLVAGWFSFEGMGATAGDLMARDVACTWLGEAGREFDVALAAPFTGGVDWRAVDPSVYSEVVFVCGPFGNGPPLRDLLDRFKSVRLVGLDVTMLEPLTAWNPFDLLLERDSSATTRPDLSLSCDQPRVPVLGLVLIHDQPEYGGDDLHLETNAALERVAAAREAAVVRIDTRLDENAVGLQTQGEVESLIARMDAVLTTRLHGMVLALKNDVPALVVDPVRGGAKISRQAETLGWPIILLGSTVADDDLQRALDFCLTVEARKSARRCRERAREALEEVHRVFTRELAVR